MMKALKQVSVGIYPCFYGYLSNHSYLVYTIDVSVILSEARRA